GGGPPRAEKPGPPDAAPAAAGSADRPLLLTESRIDAPLPPPPPPSGAPTPLPGLSGLPCAFGAYELLAEVGSGGMGVIYKARQGALGRTVALKMIHAARCGTDELERFQREARAAAALDHPNVMPVYDCGSQDGRPFFTMAFIDGPSLADLARPGPLPPAEAARLTRGAAAGVAYAHAHGILHRDLKPHNVMVDPQGRPRVTDFGLARRLQDSTPLTRDGQAVGTPSYMAPEQVRGEMDALGPATDVYGLGAILYELLTGRPPFEGGSSYSVLYRVA